MTTWGPWVLIVGGPLLGLMWLYLLHSHSPTEHPALSDDEKLRRMIALDSLRRDYIKNNKEVSENIYAGLETPPADWLNRRLKELGENWQVPTTAPRPSSDPGLFVECHFVRLPIKLPPDGRIHALNLQPLPLEAGGGGLAEYSGEAGGEFKLGPEFMTAYRCQITNYGAKPLIGMTVGLYVVFRENVKDKDNPNTSHSGDIIAQRPWRIDIQKIDPGTANPFVFYIWNMTHDFGTVSFFTTATAEYIGDPERFEFRITSAHSMPLMVNPLIELPKPQ